MSERDANESLHSMVSAEYRKLEVIFEELRAVLRPGGSGQSAAGIFQEMREEVETHFEVEDRLYYPSICALRPELKGTLATLLGHHRRFLTQFEEIAAALETEAMDDALPLFESFATEFGLHEAEEESILLEIEQSLEA